MAMSYGKWTKYKIMKGQDNLLPYLPETALLTEKNLWKFIENFDHVIVKPSLGYGGKGIVQVSNLGNEQFEMHTWYQKTRLNSRTEVLEYLKKKFSSRHRHIIQKKIPLALVEASPFDIRVMIQRKKGTTDWKVTGEMAKVAANGYIITNAARAVLPVDEAMRKSGFCKRTIRKLLKEMDHISLMTANHLQKYYKKKRRIGLDIGIDTKGQLWIIEANLTPSVSMFSKLEDKSMLTEIKEYWKG